jgi:hypothetical protein
MGVFSAKRKFPAERPVIGNQDSGKFRGIARRGLQALLQVWRVKFECAIDFAR